jgi:hypothetical protein
MSNYTQTIDFTAKDALPTGNAAKVVSGVDFDLEFGNVQASNNTKIDTGGDGLTVTDTTLDLDINSLTSVPLIVTADQVAFADASDAENSKKCTFGELATALEAEMAIANMSDYVANENIDHSGVTITAGAGMTGGGTITATRTLNVIAGTGITVNADDVALDTANSRNVDHSAVSIATSASSGLSGGGTIASTRNLSIDISGMTALTGAVVGTDGYLINDGGTSKLQTINEARVPTSTDADTLTFTDAMMMEAVHYTGGTSTHAWTMNSSIGAPGQAVMIVNDGTTDGPTITAGTATIDSSSGNYVVRREGIAILYCTTANNWKLSGDLVA